MTKKKKKEEKTISELTYNQSVNIFKQISEKYEGTKTDFILIDMALKTLASKMEKK